MNKFILRRRYWPLAPLFWALVVLAMFLWNKGEHDEKTLDLARERAHFVNKLIVATRTWAARHGGVYAPTTANNPPNPWLPADLQLLQSTDGVELTLINPSYMTRQLGDVFAEFNDMRFRLTSLNPVNPMNAADAWEEQQLHRFRKDELESVQDLQYEADQPVFRYMTPLYLDEPCLQCHTRPTDVLGTLRGGISVSFPASHLFAENRQHMQEIALAHLLIWLLLSGLTLIGLFRLRTQLLELRAINAQTEQQVVERTTELAARMHEYQQTAAQLQLFIDSSGEGIIGMDLQGLCTLINPTALHLLGLEHESQLLGECLHDRIHHSSASGEAHEASGCPMHGTITTGEQVHQEDDVFWRDDGTSFPVEYRSHPLFSDGQLIGAVINFSDISERKKREQQLEKISSAMEHSASTAVITSREGIIEYVNPHFVITTGYSREEAIGKNPSILQSGETPQEVYRQMWNNLSQGKIWVGELLNKRKDGTLYWEHVRISPITTEDGEISHFIAIKEDITERKSKENEMWQKAHFDALTGLPNRTMMHLTLDKMLQRAVEEESIAAWLYVDLDGFKKVNDTLGHAAGDQVLIETARRLQSAVRKSDLVARLGGDEFVIILEQILDESSADKIAEKIVQMIGEPFVVEEGQWSGISASVGIALYPADGKTPEQLLEIADQAMYTAKQGGGGRFEG